MSIEQNNLSNESLKEDFAETDLWTNGEQKKINRTKRETCLYVVRNITVEPSMFLFVFGIIMANLTSQNLNLEKACRVNLNFSTEICDSLREQTLGEQNEYERDVQKLVARAMAWRTYITASIPCALAPFIGSYSDKTGHRKFFLAYAIAVQTLSCINGIINWYFLYEINLEVFVLCEAILEGLSGSWCVCILTSFSYISAITTDVNRTFRLGLVNFCVTVAFPMGMAVSGVLLRAIGYYGCYGLSGGLNCLNLLYTICILKDPVRTPQQKTHDRKGTLHFFRTFFDLRNLKETFAVVFKQDSNNRRLRICIMLLVISILFGPMNGELSIMYISTRYRFSWDEVQFSIFQAYNFIAHTVGSVFSITVFSKYLQWHDSIMGIISTVSKIGGSFLYCFAPNGRIFYIAPLVDILNGTALLAIRSIASKLVLPNEFGKLNSVFALSENLMPLVYVPMYTKVYVSTMEVLPGAVFLLGTVMTIPAAVVFTYLFWEHRRNLRNLRSQGEQDSADLKYQ